MNRATSKAPRTACGAAIPTEHDHAAVHRLIDVMGERAAAEKIGISVATLTRIAAGSPVRRAGLIALRVAAGLSLQETGE